ncbi:peptidoglycan-binding protein [Actinoplanes sp. NPDC026623]|uniref:CIS tube protein n=1 Tax=Actinoplanes sp. NPDC026623 TaxID=3155610 RepID=UPI0034086BA5
MALEHATLTNLDTGERFEVLFNPSEYRLTKDNNFAQAAIPGLGSPLLQFVNGNLRTLEMELFFDTYEEHRHAGTVVNPALSDVRRLTRRVVDLISINPHTHAPPLILFAWGDLTFRGVLARVDQRFTAFLESGVPVRSQVAVTIQEWTNELTEAKEVKRQTADHSAVHEVGQRETLSAIAAAAYDDPRKWRPIAIANGLDTPRRLPAGLVLALPPLPYRDPATGEVHE